MILQKLQVSQNVFRTFFRGTSKLSVVHLYFLFAAVTSPLIATVKLFAFYKSFQSCRNCSKQISLGWSETVERNEMLRFFSMAEMSSLECICV